MKKTFAALALSLFSTAALANTGDINFVGSITPGGTCPITIVEPGNGGVELSRIVVGSHHPEYFTTPGTKSRLVPFALRVDPGTCTIKSGESGYVTFKPIYGQQGTNLYGLAPAGAGGLGLAIQDKSFTNLAPDAESAAYALDDTKPTEMIFYAAYESSAVPVTPGDAYTRVVYEVEIR